VKKPKLPKKNRGISSEEVKAARARVGLTQRDAAAIIGYTRRAWQEWEGNKRNMRLALYELFLERTK
jgi:DNA-binding transcriptional regulator YiaG